MPSRPGPWGSCRSEHLLQGAIPLAPRPNSLPPLPDPSVAFPFGPRVHSFLPSGVLSSHLPLQKTLLSLPHPILFLWREDLPQDTLHARKGAQGRSRAPTQPLLPPEGGNLGPQDRVGAKGERRQ